MKSSRKSLENIVCFPMVFVAYFSTYPGIFILNDIQLEGRRTVQALILLVKCQERHRVKPKEEQLPFLH